MLLVNLYYVNLITEFRNFARLRSCSLVSRNWILATYAKKIPTRNPEILSITTVSNIYFSGSTVNIPPKRNHYIPEFKETEINYTKDIFARMSNQMRGSARRKA